MSSNTIVSRKRKLEDNNTDSNKVQKIKNKTIKVSLKEGSNTHKCLLHSDIETCMIYSCAGVNLNKFLNMIIENKIQDDNYCYEEYEKRDLDFYS